MDDLYHLGDACNEEQRYEILRGDEYEFRVKGRKSGKEFSIPRAIIATPRWYTWKDYVRERRALYTSMLASLGLSPSEEAERLQEFDKNYR